MYRTGCKATGFAGALSGFPRLRDPGPPVAELRASAGGRFRIIPLHPFPPPPRLSPARGDIFVREAGRGNELAGVARFENIYLAGVARAMGDGLSAQLGSARSQGVGGAAR